MTTQPAHAEEPDDGLSGRLHVPAEHVVSVSPLRVTVNGEPTPEVRNALAEAGWTVMPTQHLHTAQLIPGSELEIGTFAPPLAEAAERRVGQQVVILLLGSLDQALTGKLTAVNDDATITLDDGEHRFDVALQAIAAIQGSRS